jgi:hypothetical protein
MQLTIATLVVLFPGLSLADSLGDAAAYEAKRRRSPTPVVSSSGDASDSSSEAAIRPTSQARGSAAPRSTTKSGTAASGRGLTPPARRVYDNRTLLESRDTPPTRGTFSAPTPETSNETTSTPAESGSESTLAASTPTAGPAPQPQLPSNTVPRPASTLAPTPDSGPSPSAKEIPEIARWESQMVTFGRRHCDGYDNQGLTADQRLGATYYDAMRVYYQIADYTGDAKWEACAAKARAIFRDSYVIPNKGSVPGYWNFTTGMRMDWERTADIRSKNAAIAMSRTAAYAADATPLAWTAGTVRSREVAYAIVSFIDAEAMGDSVRSRRDAQVAQALGHIDQWFISRSSRAPIPFTPVPAAAGQYYFQPFMVGLTVQALIRHWETSFDARIVPAVKVALDALWERAWVPSDESFWYENFVPHPSMTFPARPGAPDLNLLIAPAYAWLYSVTGDVKYRDRGDQVFAGGVKRAFLGSPKQFNQNYMLSFEYVKWRSRR